MTQPVYFTFLYGCIYCFTQIARVGAYHAINKFRKLYTELIIKFDLINRFYFAQHILINVFDLNLIWG